MSSSSLRPPVGIAPQSFFEEWLPRAFLDVGPPELDGALSVRTTLSGEGGGTWDLEPKESGLDVGARPDATPDVWIRQTVADFRAALEGDADLPDLMPKGWSALDLLFLDPRDREMVRQIDGRAMLEISGRRRRRWSLDVAFGATGVSAGRPRSIVRVDGDTFADVRDGRVPPVQVLLSGKVKLEGDRTLAMQILLLLGSRLARG